MQNYQAAFAKIYNMRWGNFARWIAPKIQAFYEQTETGQSNFRLLDVCCGAGHLAQYFLEQGYRITGLDLSAAMLGHAQERCSEFVSSEKAEFILGDAADFSLPEQYGLVVSTFDALNHLPSLAALEGCFRSVWQALVPGGWFIFDLNTRHGLETRWTGVQLDDTDEIFLVTRGLMVEEAGRAYTSITGFLKTESGLYERFHESAYNTIFELEAVRSALVTHGFSRAYIAEGENFLAEASDPEAGGRAFFVAQKGE